MFPFFKKIFRHQIKHRYTLKITDLLIRNNILLCHLDDMASVNPYEVPAAEIFSNDQILTQINPRELLKLKEKYDRFIQQYVMITETHQNNKYKLIYGEQEFLMEGKDICKDFNLLQSMKIEDAFRIVYSTALNDAVKINQKLTELDQQGSLAKQKLDLDNVLPLRRD